MSPNESRRSRLTASLLALAASCALGAALAAPAGAFSASGDAVIVAANHAKGRTLSGQGVKLAAGNGGSAQGGKLTLPIAEVNPVGSTPSATSASSLAFRKGKASVTFTEVRFDLSAGTIVGKYQGAAVPIFRVEGAPRVNAGSGAVSLSGGKLRLISAAASTLQNELDLARALNRKGVGMVWLSAQAKPTQIKRAVTSSSLEWGFLTSWREYIYKALGPGSVGSITTEGGATASAPGSEVAKPGAFFTFPGAGGSFEEGLFGASTTVSLNTGGAVKFAKPGHCIIGITLSDLQANINGASSSIVGNLTYDVFKPVGKTCEPQPTVSLTGIEIASLNTNGISPTYSNAGKTVTWANVPAAFSAAAVAPFGSPYKAGDPLDPVTVTVGIG